MDQIGSSVFFAFLQPSSTPPVFLRLFHLLWPSAPFSGFRIRSFHFVAFIFLR
jgi:hypothetical protein